MRVYIHTTGCSINQALGEILLKIIEKYDISQNPLEADIVILNLCAVKKPTEDKGIALAKKLVSMKKHVIITGCLAESSHKRIKREIPQANIISTGYILSMGIDAIIQRILKGEKIIVTGAPVQLKYPTERTMKNPLIGIVPIAFGCTNNCTYCIDRRIWGRVKSMPLEEVVREVWKLLDKGAVEIRLTAHDTTAYGLDRGYTLVDLLEKILTREGEYRIRIGMASPNTFYRIADALLDIIKSDNRVYNFVHIPVQSGSDRILRLMRRPYTVDEYRRIFTKVRKILGEDATIATDIISAFPTETDEDHKATVKLLQDLKPDVVNLSRYGDRPGVPSSTIRPKVHSKIAKKRTKELFELIRKISYERNLRFVNKKMNVLFLEKKGLYAGRADNNRIVYVNNHVELGKFHTVKIENITWKALYGTINL